MAQFWAARPANREDYDNALRPHDSDQYKAGWLPYSIMDGWQQLVKDFALWRADVAGEKFAKDPADREWFAFDRRLRELITLRDLGEWSHFVGDGSQPLHVTVHFNGWGDFPNPQSFTLATNFHARFETDFINANISEDDVTPLLAAPIACHCSIQQHTADYLARTGTYVVETYRLDQSHGFDNATPEAKRFVAARLAEGAAMLRDMVTDAWTASGDTMLGYKPQVSVKDSRQTRSQAIIGELKSTSWESANRFPIGRLNWPDRGLGGQSICPPDAHIAKRDQENPVERRTACARERRGRVSAEITT